MKVRGHQLNEQEERYLGEGTVPFAVRCPHCRISWVKPFKAHRGKYELPEPYKTCPFCGAELDVVFYDGSVLRSVPASHYRGNFRAAVEPSYGIEVKVE